MRDEVFGYSIFSALERVKKGCASYVAFKAGIWICSTLNEAREKFKVS